MEQHVIQTSDITPCHGPGFMGEGQVAMGAAINSREAHTAILLGWEQGECCAPRPVH